MLILLNSFWMNWNFSSSESLWLNYTFFPFHSISFLSFLSPAFLSSLCFSSPFFLRTFIFPFLLTSYISCISTLFDPMDCSMPGLSVPHYLSEFTQVHIYCISDAIQPSHALTPSSPSAFHLSQHQGLFQCAVCLHQMTKILELQHQSFQWIFRVELP